MNYKTYLKYRASQDGFEAADFHSRCDEIGPTVSLFKIENGFTIAGYTSASWRATKDFTEVSDRSAMLLNLTE